MMMLKRRCTGWRATGVAGTLILFVSMNPASGGIISDRSAFVGDFTVLDFETLGDGTPIDFREGGFTLIEPDEYSLFGVDITSSGNFVLDERPLLANFSSAQWDEAQRVAGSPKNMLADGGFAMDGGVLRFDFNPSVNAVGMVILASTPTDPVILTAFSATGQVLEIVEFTGNLIDGTILGIDFGNPLDVNYGFVGVFSTGDDIAYAELLTDGVGIDDLYFGAIPEPTTSFLLAAGLVGIWFLKRRRCRGQIGVLAIAAILVLGTAGVGFAQQEIAGNVSAWVVDGPAPICGDFGPLGCTQVPLTSFRCVFHSARFCLEPQACGEMK